MRNSNSYMAPLVVGLVALFVMGLIYRPLLYVLLGILAIAGLLFFLIVSSQQSRGKQPRYKPPASSGSPWRSLGGGNGSAGARAARTQSESSGTPAQGSDTQTVLLVIALVIGFFIIVVAG